MKKEIEHLYNFADAIKRDLIIRRCSRDLYHVQFENCGVTQCITDSHITYMFGRGATIEDALLDYAERISGSILVDIYNPYRMLKYTVPNLIGDL